MKRARLHVSMSYSNADAVTVMQALRRVQKGQRSRLILSWAAGYLNGEVSGSHTQLVDQDAMSEEEFNRLLDDL